MHDFDERYITIWQDFTKKVSGLTKDIIEIIKAEDEVKLHDLLRSLQNVPYNEAPALFDGLSVPGEKRSNIGSVTGLFFEIITASLVIGYIKKHLPEAVIELNSCSSKEVACIARDPDIFVSYNDRYAVFETKTSPKSRDLLYVRDQRAKYLSSSKVQYYLVGGHTSINKSILEQFAEEKWACFVSTSKRNESELVNFPTLDEILEKSVQHLTGR